MTCFCHQARFGQDHVVLLLVIVLHIISRLVDEGAVTVGHKEGWARGSSPQLDSLLLAYISAFALLIITLRPEVKHF